MMMGKESSNEENDPTAVPRKGTRWTAADREGGGQNNREGGGGGGGNQQRRR